MTRRYRRTEREGASSGPGDRGAAVRVRPRYSPVTAPLLSRGYNVEELEKHISLLHEYNEIKDAGQMLLGKLAVIRGVTTKQLYPEYDLELND
ncbi:DNA repair protein SWI5 homolog [Coturnix japonica]|uniref:DNA repair protein SWI5 homolog n=1 Tax=Coturnix japonica TaxID=93934 RepID=UPI0013A5D8AA|nr:DNA repair protein SWI5 homolog [Coturnix japonica]